MAVIPKLELKNHQQISEAPSYKSKIQLDVEDLKTMSLGKKIFIARFQLSLMKRINMAALPKATLI
jgi:hypothetical protein